VLLTIVEFLTWFQPEATGAPDAGGGGAGAPGGCMGASSQLILLPVMFAVFYFMLIRPQQKRQREIDDMLKALKRGDKVRTSGGIRGEIAELNDHDVNLVVADRVKINVLRAHIAGLDTPAAAESKDKPAADDKADKPKNG
jgi:preprotein translocase subunit YajC